MVLRYLACLVVFIALNVPPGPRAAGAACEELTNTRLALHIEAPTSKRGCGLTQLTCSPDQLVSMGDLHQTYKVYVLLMDPSNQSMQEIQFGVDFDPAESSGVDVLSFESCAESSTPIGDWPNPGSQIRLTYSACQATDPNQALVLGWFWVSAETPGSMSIGPLYQPNGNAATVCRLWDCGLNEKMLNPARYGRIGFGGAYAFDCGFIDIFPGPCCVNDLCASPSSGLGCCWAQNGDLLDYTASCAACALPVLPNTWGRLKSRY